MTTGSSLRVPAGYYLAAVDYQVAVCTDCYSGTEDDREIDEPIGYWHETDYPVHCQPCSAPLETTLTSEGRAYIEEALEIGGGDPDVLDAWRRLLMTA